MAERAGWRAVGVILPLVVIGYAIVVTIMHRAESPLWAPDAVRNAFFHAGAATGALGLVMWGLGHRFPRWLPGLAVGAGALAALTVAFGQYAAHEVDKGRAPLFWAYRGVLRPFVAKDALLAEVAVRARMWPELRELAARGWEEDKEDLAWALYSAPEAPQDLLRVLDEVASAKGEEALEAEQSYDWYTAARLWDDAATLGRDVHASAKARRCREREEIRAVPAVVVRLRTYIGGINEPVYDVAALLWCPLGTEPGRHLRVLGFLDRELAGLSVDDVEGRIFNATEQTIGHVRQDFAIVDVVGGRICSLGPRLLVQDELAPQASANFRLPFVVPREMAQSPSLPEDVSFGILTRHEDSSGEVEFAYDLQLPVGAGWRLKAILADSVPESVGEAFGVDLLDRLLLCTVGDADYLVKPD